MTLPPRGGAGLPIGGVAADRIAPGGGIDNRLTIAILSGTRRIFIAPLNPIAAKPCGFARVVGRIHAFRAHCY
jgi:hypothetical protein